MVSVHSNGVGVSKEVTSPDTIARDGVKCINCKNVIKYGVSI